MATTIGCDPEICMTNQDGEVVPVGWAFDVWEQQGLSIIPAPQVEAGQPPKGRKLALSALGPGHYIYEDGASVEFNVPPTTSPSLMMINLGSVLQETERLTKLTPFRLDIKASLPITPAVIERGGVALAQFGCDVDFTPWDDPHDPSMIDARTCYNRFYGGHIHMGNPDGADEEFYYDNRWETSLTCDLLLGLADVLIDHSDAAKVRRQVYGRIGRHRVQTYAPRVHGYEYRVPSNGWLRTPATTGFMFRMAKMVQDVVSQPGLYSFLVDGVNLDQLKETINTTDQNAAREMYEGVVVPFFQHYAFNVADDHMINIELPLDPPDASDWRKAWSI